MKAVETQTAATEGQQSRQLLQGHEPGLDWPSELLWEMRRLRSAPFRDDLS